MKFKQLMSHMQLTDSSHIRHSQRNSCSFAILLRRLDSGVPAELARHFDGLW